VVSSVVPLGRLEKVALRQAWPDERSNFTPWLAQESNLAQLGEGLGLQLEPEAVEKQVGPFAADILAKSVPDGRWVLIENQIEPTDHNHLGQLLTYAAGLDARIIIWIAETFREEHRAALDFLNQATSEDYAFFAVQIELYRIGESALAPRFSIVAKPNNWSKQAHAARQVAEGELNEIQKLSLEYWSKLIASAKGQYQNLANRNPYKGNYQRFEQLRGGDPGAWLNAVFPWDKSLRLEVYIDGLLAKEAFNKLHENKVEIETAFGQPLVWEELPDNRASRISFYMPGNEKRENRESWGKQHEWLITWAPKLSQAVRPFLANLEIELVPQAADS
jgi:hypothetical protein